MTTASSILSMGKAIEPMELPHFPTRFQAVIWRNWGLVPAERLATLLRSTTDTLAEEAVKMGLPTAPEINPRWLTAGYLTILRNNWHLLPYEQLLELLQWTPERLAITLSTEDFFWQKMGCGKPPCEAVYWQPLTQEQAKATEDLRQILNRHYPDGLSKVQEPSFAFLEKFTTCNLAGDTAPFTLSFIHPYCAGCGDIWGNEDGLDTITEGLLAQYAAMGVTGIWLHSVLYLLCPVPGAEEFSVGWQQRRERMRKLAQRCQKHGLKLFLYMNEPRSLPQAFFDKKPAWRGIEMPLLNTFTICTTGSAEPLLWLEEAMRNLWTAVPELGGAFCITMSENPTNCHYRASSDQCPSCSKVPPAKILADILTAMERGMHAAAPEAAMIAFAWEWRRTPDDRMVTDRELAFVKEILPLLPSTVSLACVSENNLPVQVCGVEQALSDYSISQIGPSDKSRATWEAAQELGLPAVAKIQANNSWELSAVPYLPVPYLVREHLDRLKKAGVTGLMLSWTLGGYPGGNLEMLKGTPEQIAAEKFHSELAEEVCHAWRLFSDAFLEFPFCQAMLYTGPVNYGPKNLLCLKPSGHRATMIGFPYDDLKIWCGPYPTAVIESQFERLTSIWQQGLSILEKASASVTRQEKQNFSELLMVAKAAYCHFRSTYLQIRFIRLRDEAPDHQAMAEALQEEIGVTKQLLEIMLADSRIGFEASNHYFYTSNDLLEKIVSCELLMKQLA